MTKGEWQVESQKNLATHLLLTYYSLGTLKTALGDGSAWERRLRLERDVADSDWRGMWRLRLERDVANQLKQPGATTIQIKISWFPNSRKCLYGWLKLDKAG